jgi:hypothetical protein
MDQRPEWIDGQNINYRPTTPSMGLAETVPI